MKLLRTLLFILLLPCLFQSSEAWKGKTIKKYANKAKNAATKVFNSAGNGLLAGTVPIGALEKGILKAKEFVGDNLFSYWDPTLSGLVNRAIGPMKKFVHSTVVHTLEEAWKHTKNFAKDAYKWVKNQIEDLFGCLLNLADGVTIDDIFSCMGLGEEFRCMDGAMTDTAEGLAEVIGNALSVDTLEPMVMGFFDGIEKALDESTETLDVSDVVDPAKEIISYLEYVPGMDKHLDDVDIPSEVPLPNMEKIIGPTLDAIVEEMTAIFENLEDEMKTMGDAWLGCYDRRRGLRSLSGSSPYPPLCFVWSFEKSFGPTFKPPYFSPRFSLSFCLPDQKFLLDIDIGRFKFVKHADFASKFKVKTKFTEQDKFVDGVQDKDAVDVVSSTGLTLGLDSVIGKGWFFMSADWFGDMKIGVSGISVKGGTSIDLSLFKKSSIHEPALTLTFQKLTIKWYCTYGVCNAVNFYPKKDGHHDDNHEEEDDENHRRRLEPLEELSRQVNEPTLSDMIARTDSIPAATDLVFMIGTGNECMRVYDDPDIGPGVYTSSCSDTDPAQEFSMDGGLIMSLLQSDYCLGHYNQDQWLDLVWLVPCIDPPQGYKVQWESLPNGAIVSAANHNICMHGIGGQLYVDHDCNPYSPSTDKFFWITKSFMLASYDDGGVKCLWAPPKDFGKYDRTYLSSCADTPFGSKEFLLTSNGMIYNPDDPDGEGRAMTRNPFNGLTWSTFDHGGDSQLFTFTVDGKIQHYETKECLATNSRTRVHHDFGDSPEVFLADCDYFDVKNLIESPSGGYEKFGNIGNSNSCLIGELHVDGTSQLKMGTCLEKGLQITNMQTQLVRDWKLQNGQLVSKTSNDDKTCVDIDDEENVIISKSACDYDADLKTVYFTYDTDTFWIKVLVPGNEEEKCLDVDNNIVVLSECSKTRYGSRTQMFGIKDIIGDWNFLVDNVPFWDGQSRIYSPEYGPSWCLSRRENDLFLKETDCTDERWHWYSGTHQISPKGDWKSCLDAHEGKLVQCDYINNGIGESQEWTYDRSTLMLHSTVGTEKRCLKLDPAPDGKEVRVTVTSDCNEDDPLQRFGPSWKPLVFDKEDTPTPLRNVETNENLSFIGNFKNAGDPSCETGVLNGGGQVCCLESCGTCGGSGCGSRDGGAGGCCIGTIMDSFVSCMEHGPPCVMEDSNEYDGPTLVLKDIGLGPQLKIGDIPARADKWMLHTDGTLSPSDHPFACAKVMNDNKLRLHDCTDDNQGYIKTFSYDPETLQLSYEQTLYDDTDGMPYFVRLCVGYESDPGLKMGVVMGNMDCDSPEKAKMQWIF